MLKSFRELEVWQKAHAFVLDIYRATSAFPSSERFGIVSQIRRSAMSIPANIAEGFGRRTTKDFLQFLTIANGSLEETRYFMILSKDLRYLAVEEYESLDRQAISIGQMLGALSRSLHDRVQTVSRVAGRGARVAMAGRS
ncbi:MAG TPA: four helix bundle protein [Candidatus Acidoferrales bacterium]|nr:four helix bundle protein [Candidatus Acidoferrales bacterium]